MRITVLSQSIIMGLDLETFLMIENKQWLSTHRVNETMADGSAEPDKACNRHTSRGRDPYV